ncbi:hypothetical protein [uncultured Rubinisphaera sp.]|uniref:hypothetical protein n=1 Tax=uncultured Rubinisphaera sp. TaxID=1678686 RepID=UPI0030DD19D5|tara:strand:+ start:361 stop:774 length:414 start_codon:yes stop_codon:yes gene_type:complete
MRLPLSVLAGMCLSVLLFVSVHGDDLKINTPVVSANLKGNWELQLKEAGAFRQTLQLGPQFSGQWQQSQETHPVTIAWFVEGGELRILHYYEPEGAFNYRVKTLMVPYELDNDILVLTFDGKPSTWKRAKLETTATP